MSNSDELGRTRTFTRTNSDKLGLALIGWLCWLLDIKEPDGRSEWR